MIERPGEAPSYLSGTSRERKQASYGFLLPLDKLIHAEHWNHISLQLLNTSELLFPRTGRVTQYKVSVLEAI